MIVFIIFIIVGMFLNFQITNGSLRGYLVTIFKNRFFVLKYMKNTKNLFGKKGPHLLCFLCYQYLCFQRTGVLYVSKNRLHHEPNKALFF